jgi:hypothetical protein
MFSHTTACKADHSTVCHEVLILLFLSLINPMLKRTFLLKAASPYTLRKHLWIQVGFWPSAKRNMIKAHCFKGTSISAITDSTVALPPVKWNSCDYLKMTENVHGLQWTGIFFFRKMKALQRWIIKGLSFWLSLVCYKNKPTSTTLDPSVNL